jgi:hypothetical protein
VLAVLAVLVTGCSADDGDGHGDGNEAAAAATTTPTGPATDVAEPLEFQSLTPGTRYRFADVLPGLVDVDVTAPDATLYPVFDSAVVALSPEADGGTDAVAVLAPTEMRVPLDPYDFVHLFAGPDEVLASTTALPVAPEDVLEYLEQLPFVEVTVPERPVTVVGVEGRAVDVRIGDLPPAAEACAGVLGFPRCVGTVFMPAGIGFVVVPGESLRFIEVEPPGGTLLIQQNLDLPEAQAALDGMAFVPHEAS